MGSRCERRARVACNPENGQGQAQLQRHRGMLPGVDKWEKQQMGLLFATSVEFRGAMGSRSREGKVSVSAGQQEEARKKEWTEKQEREGGMRANTDSRHGAETCNRTEFHLHHNHRS